ncbi:endonuclease/exonuclease/phosphatase family protein [Ahniella affigens]|uniref:endonuclease/exonuclease/phosphatase family protein n=1 Tax=Ahniella affigens TaxID=2021234 RepID=UPI00197E780D|nr:endonuclease/exonuclease/phosphatase family protein [Ahniella affigens]
MKRLHLGGLRQTSINRLQHVLFGGMLVLLGLGSAFAQQLERAPDTAFRYLSWNVSRENFIERQSDMLAILRAAKADVIMLDELPKDVTHESLVTFATKIDGDTWQVVLGQGGGIYQRAAVISRQPSRRLDAFDQLGYADSHRQEWLADAGLERRSLEFNLSLGIPVAAAELEFTPFTLIVVGMDLQCCGNSPGAWQERRRRAETMTIRDTLDQTWTHQTAVIVSGDFNNVQGMMPVETIAGAHLADPSRHLRRAEAVRPDGQTDWTWDGRNTEFPSRPLDHVLYSDALSVLNALVLDTETLPDATLKANDLTSDLSNHCSDHRPVVVDFGWAVQVPPSRMEPPATP